MQHTERPRFQVKRFLFETRGGGAVGRYMLNGGESAAAPVGGASFMAEKDAKLQLSARADTGSRLVHLQLTEWLQISRE